MVVVEEAVIPSQCLSATSPRNGNGLGARCLCTHHKSDLREIVERSVLIIERSDIYIYRVK